MPARGAALVVGDDVVAVVVEVWSEGDGAVVVTVVVLGGGAASDGRGVGSASRPEEANTDARIAATPNSTTVPTTSAICGRPNRLGDDGCGAGAGS